MKTYEIIKNMKIKEKMEMGQNSPLGLVTIRKTKKGIIISNAYGNQYITDDNISNAVGNYNAIGLAGKLDYSRDIILK
jgi:hypothetical protein